MNSKVLLLILIPLIMVMAIPPVSATGFDTAAFIEKASVYYRNEFTVARPLVSWNRMLDFPVVMGALWNLYDFDPQYYITYSGRGYHIIDPTGIEGDLREIPTERERTRMFIANGKLKNWGIPVSLVGKALFIVESVSNGDSVAVSLDVYGEGGDSVVMRMLLKAVSPILEHLINKRVSRNLDDFAILVEDLNAAPQPLRDQLPREYHSVFNHIMNNSGD